MECKESITINLINENWAITLQNRDSSVSGMPLTMVIQFMPLTEERKLEMLSELLKQSKPIFQDKTIMVLMLLIAVFDLENNETVRRVQRHIQRMLNCYLEEKNKNCSDVYMASIMNCVSDLSQMLEFFQPPTTYAE